MAPCLRGPAIALALTLLSSVRPAVAHDFSFERFAVLQLAHTSLDLLVEVRLPAGARASLMRQVLDVNRNGKLEGSETNRIARSLAMRGVAGINISMPSNGAIFDLSKGLRTKYKRQKQRAARGGHTGFSAAALIHLKDLAANAPLRLEVSLPSGIEPVDLIVQTLAGACLRSTSRGEIGPDGAVAVGKLYGGQTVMLEFQAGPCAR